MDAPTTSSDVAAADVPADATSAARQVRLVAVSTAAEQGATGSVLLVGDQERERGRLAAQLRSAGFDVVAVGSAEVQGQLGSSVPDAVVADVAEPGTDDVALVRHVRAQHARRHVPLLLLASRYRPQDVAACLALGADDYLTKPVHSVELGARIQARVLRSGPYGDGPVDRHVGVLGEERFLEEVGRELHRYLMSGRDGWVAVVDAAERAAVRRRLGPRGEAELVTALAQDLRLQTTPFERLGRSDDGRLLVLVTETPEAGLVAALRRYSVGIASSHIEVIGEALTVTPVVGYVRLGDEATPTRVRTPGDPLGAARSLVARAGAAQRAAASDLNLQPQRWVEDLPASPPGPSAPGPARGGLRVAGQLLVTLALGVALPWALFVGCYLAGVDVSSVVYAVVVAATVLTALLIWLEGLLALTPPEPPKAPEGAPPRASAVIAAYLPNEAATVLETVESFLAVDYPDLEIVLAYNSPQVLPVEEALQLLARDHPLFTALRVEGSTSKAQNINAALQHVTGEFIGIFDADHHPARDSFRRAWRWVAGGFDVVQGHCVVRNGDVSWVSRTVAVEFEAIYAVSHPGRARLHGFGVFGGSNGYWKASTLRSTRLFGSMLTEDIDSSIRLLLAGGKIASDPKLISRELAPTTVAQLWNQRMRWAQGWFQVSLRYLLRGVFSSRLSLRQKIGLLILLGWRETYAWVSLQVIPLLAFLAWRDGGVGAQQWFAVAFVLTTLFTLSTGPGQVLFAYRLAVPELQRRKRWFWSYLIGSLAYTEWKNIVSRIAQVKEAAGERVWRVTPRGAGSGSGAAG